MYKIPTHAKEGVATFHWRKLADAPSPHDDLSKPANLLTGSAERDTGEPKSKDILQNNSPECLKNVKVKKLS